jgi:hypothetical protein
MGAIKGEGIKNQLGRPHLGRFVLLVREAAQNAWDARDPERDCGPIRFWMDITTMAGKQGDEWRRLLEVEAPSAGHLPLRQELVGEIAVLFVSDRGTTGLGGPTRADEAREDEPHDYVSFVLNIGDPRDTDFGGGTYGFGKAVFFNASAASTILVHSRARVGAGVESRLVGCALGTSFELEGRVYTGRHWFGLEQTEKGVVEPVVGPLADSIAAALGFPAFANDETGTTVAVVAPSFESQTPSEVAHELALATLWHLWPKMVDLGGGPGMQFRVTDHGEEVRIQDPEEHPVIREFVHALRGLGQGERVTYGAQRMPVGRIRLRTTFAPPPVIDEVGLSAGIDGAVHHCCLLRAPELVVEYRPGPRLPNENLWYAGVFRADDEQDAVFARAEPPTHDAWEPASLDGAERSLVRTTLRKVDEALRQHAAPRPSEGSSGGGDGLAGMSRLLGHLIAPAPGQGAGRGVGRGARGGRRTQAVKMLDSPRWERVDGTDVLIQAFEVSAGRGVTVDADVSVRLWGGGGAEGDPPLGAELPRLIAWRSPDGSVHPPGRLAVRGDEAGRWEAVVSVPADTATSIRVRVARESGDD